MESLPRGVGTAVAVTGGASYYTLWIKNGMVLRSIWKTQKVDNYTCRNINRKSINRLYY